jgi:PAS domain S-box-containing protein
MTHHSPSRINGSPGSGDQGPLRLLCLEDNPNDFELMMHVLAADGLQCEMINVKGAEDFLAALEKGRFDLIISDFSMPAYDGLSALKSAQILHPHTPFLFVSGSIGEERAINGLKAGAADFVLKDHLEQLPPVVRSVLEKARERSKSTRTPETPSHPRAESNGNNGNGTARPVNLAGSKIQPLQMLHSAALAAAANGIMITGRDGIILWVNPAFSKLTGYSAEEVLDHNPRMFKSGNHDQSFYQEFWDTILSGQTWRGEFVNRRKDGSLYVAEQTITPVREPTGEITHFISVAEDVTERRHLEEQLRQAQKLQAVGQLAAGVAHEFNNLLTTIRCNGELLTLSKHGLAAESQNLLQRILTASDRAATLIRQLGVFSREQVLQSEPLNLNEVLEALITVLRANTEDIQWQCDYAPDLPSIKADAGMIRQVVLNLVNNAIDAMARCGCLTLRTEKISVSAASLENHPEAQPGEFVCLTICDNGCGISPENLARIFEPFFTTKEVGRGTGLGLATVYGIVKQHHGWIEVASQVNQGTTCKVFLPVMAVSS